MSKYDNNAPYIYRSAAGRVPRSSGPPPTRPRWHIRAAAARRRQAGEPSAAWAIALKPTF